MGRGSTKLDPGSRVTLRASFSAAARRALRRAGRVALTVEVTAVEHATKDVSTAKVTLHR